MRDTNRDLAALLAVAAHRFAPGAESESALFATFTGEPGFVGYLPRGAAEYRAGAFLPGSHDLAVLDANGDLRIFETDSLREVANVSVASNTEHDARLAVSPDGGTIVVASGSPGSGRATTEIPLYELRSAPGEIRVLDTVTHELRYAPIRVESAPHSVAVSPDNALFAVASEGGRVEVARAC